METLDFLLGAFVTLGSTFAGVFLAYWLSLRREHTRKEEIDRDNRARTLRNLWHELWLNKANLDHGLEAMSEEELPVVETTDSTVAMELAVNTGYLDLLPQKTVDRLVSLYSNIRLSEFWVQGWFTFLVSPVRGWPGYQETKRKTRMAASKSQEALSNTLIPIMLDRLNSEREKMGETRVEPPSKDELIQPRMIH
jgi:hypothetical protein